MAAWGEGLFLYTVPTITELGFIIIFAVFYLTFLWIIIEVNNPQRAVYEFLISDGA
jgi:hypothetical protein